MKAHIIQLHRNYLPERSFLTRKAWSVASPVRSILIILATALPATAIAVLTVLAFSSQAQGVAAAAIWATGFVFLALSVENNGSRALLLGVSAVVLMLCAWLGSELATEFGVLGGFIVAGWTAFAVSQQLLRPADITGVSNESAENS